jgi:hypothetical protein
VVGSSSHRDLAGKFLSRPRRLDIHAGALHWTSPPPAHAAPAVATTHPAVQSCGRAGSRRTGRGRRKGCRRVLRRLWPPPITSRRVAGGTRRKGHSVSIFLMSRSKGGWLARRVWRVGRLGVGDKNITFSVETLPKLRFLWLFHLFGHHAS